jgi:hypothetical protein
MTAFLKSIEICFSPFCFSLPHILTCQWHFSFVTVGRIIVEEKKWHKRPPASWHI